MVCFGKSAPPSEQLRWPFRARSAFALELQRLPLQIPCRIEDDFRQGRIAGLSREKAAMLGLAAELLKLLFHRDS